MQVLFNKYFIFDSVIYHFAYYFICDRIRCVMVNIYSLGHLVIPVME